MSVALNQSVSINKHNKDARPNQRPNGDESPCKSTSGNVTEIKGNKVIAQCTCCNYKQQIT